MSVFSFQFPLLFQCCCCFFLPSVYGFFSTSVWCCWMSEWHNCARTQPKNLKFCRRNATTDHSLFKIKSHQITYTQYSMNIICVLYHFVPFIVQQNTLLNSSTFGMRRREGHSNNNEEDLLKNMQFGPDFVSQRFWRLTNFSATQSLLR